LAASDVRDQLQTALGAQYTLDRELGRGGMATVYLAQDTKHHRPVALKVLNPELATTLGPERFRREIALAAALQHPHILPVLDSGETPDAQLWFTMPYVEGESLRERIVRERHLPVHDAMRIGREVAAAVQYAHQHGVLHRDIKPENILLTTQGEALLADFGIARSMVATTGGTSLTVSGLAVGTPQYMSPEQAAGDRTLDARSDVYALGAVCYEMLAGEPPFVASSAQAVVAKMLSGDAPSVRVLRPGVSPAIDAAIRRALSRVPADRWATAAEFARALTTAEQTGATPRPPGRVPMTAALLIAGFLVGAGALFAWRRYDNGTPPAGPLGLAVLPFENEGDTANAYFASGITDEIRSKLSALPALRLIASNSSNQYRHTVKPPEQIGRELGVRYLLTGRVHWEQEANGTRRVRVSPELVEVRDGIAPETRWQQSYDTTLADVFDVQTTVATQVADKLGVVLSPPAQSQLAARPTQNLAAYEAYLRSTALDGVDPATVRLALATAEQAVALDSGYAAAWARVSTRHARIYSATIPTRADADAARAAAERAVALAPDAPDGYIARGFYSLLVAHDAPAARAAYEHALRLQSSSSEAMRWLAAAEMTGGQWAPALGHARQAVALDPRSPDAAYRLTRLLLWLRRYPDARDEANRELAIAPADLALTEHRSMSQLGEGDLAAARAGLRDIPPTLDRAALAVFYTTNWHLQWVLDSADRALVLTQPPAAFDDDRGSWGLVRAELYDLAGDAKRTHIYADSARIAYEAQVHAMPDDVRRNLYHALALAYLGQRAAAAREGEHALTLAQATGDQYVRIPYARHLLAWIYVMGGDHPHALAQLDTLLAEPYLVSPAWLRIDPTWAPLKGDPRFERLLAQPATSPQR
jgi:eukaryotic-like serine/threonine-protein kinase